MILNTRKKILVFSCLLTMTAQFGMSLYLPSFLTIKNALLFSDTSIQKSLSFFVLGYGSLMLFWGGFAEYFGRKNTLLLTSFIFLMASYSLTLVNNIIFFDLLRIVQGAASGGLAVIGRVLIRDNFYGKELIRNMALLSVAYVLAFPVSQILGSVLDTCYGWYSNFLFLAFLGFLIGSLTLLQELNANKESINNNSGNKNFFEILCGYRLIINKRFLSIALIGSTGYVVYIIYQTISPIYLMETLEFSKQEYSKTSLLNTGAYLLGIFILHRAIKYVESKKTMYITMLVIIFLGIGSFLSNYFLSGSYFLTIMMLVTLVTAWLYPLCFSIALEEFNNTGAQATAAFGFLQQLFAFVFSWLIAKQVNNISMLGCMLTFLGLVGVSLMFLFIDRMNTDLKKRKKLI
jgi:DHA1 family bicyclomycin/chloramphenicol resistance-like MFS transporter